MRSGPVQADRHRRGGLIEPRQGVTPVLWLGQRRRRHDIGDVLVERFLGPLLDQGEFGVELVATLDAFLAAGMNTAVAARALVVHPNTLRYRINQVKRLSGITLRSAQETSEVWWALRRYEWARRTGHLP